MNHSPHVRYILVPIHILGVMALFCTHYNWIDILYIWLAWFITGGIGTEVGLHRLYSHKSFLIKSKIMKWGVGWAACMGGQWSPIFWAALHRGYHHPGCDTNKDLHSPIHGKWQAYSGWLFDLKDNDVNLSYVKDLIIDPIQQILHKHYLKIFWSTLTIFFIINIHLFFVMVIGVLLAIHQENIVNLFCHIKSRLAYRNFETNDNSVNIYILGLLFWGQGFHNNHHAKPNRYDFGIKFTEIDICRWIVPAIVWIDNRIGK
jgi:fatty-acid desaturase